nr:hypothetical protein [Antrihabitans sp. YC2-6]
MAVGSGVEPSLRIATCPAEDTHLLEEFVFARLGSELRQRDGCGGVSAAVGLREYSTCVVRYLVFAGISQGDVGECATEQAADFAGARQLGQHQRRTVRPGLGHQACDHSEQQRGADRTVEVSRFE